jgi:nicotinamide mononucleotide transporter
VNVIDVMAAQLAVMNPLEAAAALLALGMVALNIRQMHWGWGLAIASALLYAWVFWQAELFGQAVLQGVFVLVAAWGWVAWRRGVRDILSAPSPSLPVTRLTRGQWGLALAAAALLALAFTLGLSVLAGRLAWLDGTLSACAVVAQVLLGLKKRESWLWWLFVNAASLALFAEAGLWLTTALYALFTALSMMGWRAWRKRSP